MNEILLRLLCRECNQSLRPQPFEANRLGFYAVPLFNCLNEQCIEYKNTIRLTHCLNGNCNGENKRIIDSRDCPNCSNGWLVCQDCFSCCPLHHESKVISCPDCGSGMNQNDSEFECLECGKIIKHEEAELIIDFWKREVNYEDKIVNH
jgi:hypothetical protein